MIETLHHAFRVFCLILLFGFAPSISAEQKLVRDQAEYWAAMESVEAGDTIVLANGDWQDFEIVFAGTGTAEQPITLTAQTKGSVRITGVSNLRLAGEYLVVSGLIFADGYTPTNEVISFRRTKQDLAHHSRVTEVVIDHFNNPERFEKDFWVMMYGSHNRFDHNYLTGKSNAGVTLAVKLDSEASQNNHHRIDHNYFGPRQTLGSNGGETFRIGTSKYSLTDSYTVVENNYFDRCNGEVEIVSSKSGKNTFRGNVFYESQGTLTLRHGNDNLLEDNVFFGNGIAHTGGIRVINKRQRVRNNYMSGLTGYRFGGGLVVMNGVPNSPINRYHQVEESVIENNSIVDVEHVEFAAGSDEERSAVPLSTTFKRNLIVNSKPMASIAVHDDVGGIDFSDNVISGVKKLPIKRGFTKKAVKLEKNAEGLKFPSGDRIDANVGVDKSLTVLKRSATGPSWYPKPPQHSQRFDTGVTHSISPGQDTLTAAIEEAQAGDIIELAPGEYIVTKILVTDRPLTIRGQAKQPRPHILFQRSTLFELSDGGSLKLESLFIDGTDAPDAYGNSAVRTSRYSMLSNYEIRVIDSEVRNLNTNHSFNFLKVAQHTFADSIEIRDTQMSEISGHVIALDREIDDLGIYNGEYITITDSSFENVGGALATIYRGGTDESTFGPHFTLTNSTLENVGNNRKRNKTKSSLNLLGVQVTRIEKNRFSNSMPIRVFHTVGGPITQIDGNKFHKTPKPEVTQVTR